jgi:hypothetical protein
MTPVLVALIAGWFLFIIVWLLWSFWSYLQTLQEGSGRRPLSSPKRNTLRLILFAITNLVWLSLIGGLAGLSGYVPVDFDDLVCLWIILVPSTGFAIIMSHLIDQKRIRMLQEEQKSIDRKDKSETGE